MCVYYKVFSTFLLETVYNEMLGATPDQVSVILKGNLEIRGAHVPSTMDLYYGGNSSFFSESASTFTHILGGKFSRAL